MMAEFKRTGALDLIPLELPLSTPLLFDVGAMDFVVVAPPRLNDLLVIEVIGAVCVMGIQGC